MKQYRDTVRVQTGGKSFSRVTGDVNRIIQQSGIQSGICSLFLQHTSASLVIQENADPDVLRDLATFLAQLVPEDNRYLHGMEGPDDMPAHIRTALTSTSEHIPIANGRLMLGTWQGIYVWEHRDRSHSRELIVHALGDS
ncbi:MAG: secondary thiamine-phosphate synthase enzyme YjbQ [Cyanobacteria bacterium J06597_1]